MALEKILVSGLEDISIIACLRCNDVPVSLLGASDYQKLSCDFCSSPIWVSMRAQQIMENFNAAKACTLCISSCLQMRTELKTGNDALPPT